MFIGTASPPRSSVHDIEETKIETTSVYSGTVRVCTDTYFEIGIVTMVDFSFLSAKFYKNDVISDSCCPEFKLDSDDYDEIRSVTRVGDCVFIYTDSYIF